MLNQRQHIENLNYYNDPRTQAPAEAPTVFIMEGEDEVEVQLPMRYEVCHVCEGHGTHVNPSIDAGGINPDVFHDDPDFADSYFSGHYDVTCNNCGGKRVEPVVDEDRCDPAHLEAYYEQARENAAYEAARRAELAMGA